MTPYVEVNDRQANFDMRTGAELFAGRDGNSRALYEPYKNGWQPRFGLAWTPSQFQGRAVIRIAYGILNYLESTGTNRRLPMNPPFVYDFLSVNDNRFLGPPIRRDFRRLPEQSAEWKPARVSRTVEARVYSAVERYGRVSADQ